MALPTTFERHINLKREYAHLFSLRPKGMARAFKHAKLPLGGARHRGIDASNIVKLALLIPPLQR